MSQLFFLPMFQSICFISSESSVRDEYSASLITKYTIHASDVLTIDDETVGIGHVRSVINFATHKPYASKYKIIRINGDGLTQEAQQALLKILEEPPATTILVLQVGSEKLLLPTILSRCLCINNSNSGEKLTSDQQTQTKLYWKNLLAFGIGKRLMETTQLASDRGVIAAWLEDQIFFFRSELHASYKNASGFTSLQCLHILKTLQQTYSYTKMNVNLKILIDHLFLHLPQIEA